MEKKRAHLEEIRKEARVVAREEVASLCGLVLRRLQDKQPKPAVLSRQLESAFAEALRDFGGTESEPGEDEKPNE